MPGAFAAQSHDIDREGSGAQARKTLFVHYMPWFESKPVRGAWGKHWTGSRGQFDPEKTDVNGLPELASHYHPLIGPYDSSDPHAIECHLLQMKLAGIDGVIVDWYGISQHSDYPAIHQATEAIFAGTAKYGLKFAVCFEDRTIKRLVESGELAQGQVANHLAETFRWLEKNWFSAPHYFRIADQPLLLNFGPIFVTSPHDWQAAFAPLTNRPRFFALNHLWKEVKADGGFTWVYPQVWTGSPPAQVIQERLTSEFNRVTQSPAETIVSAFPGFNDRYEKAYPDIAHRDGETLRETLTACLAGSWPIVQLVTWNDFGEGTMIEPCHEFGYLFLEIVQQARRQEIREVFAFGSSDLRLPGKLFELRQAETADSDALDLISDQLACGQTHAAKAALDQLTSSHFDKDTIRQVGGWPTGDHSQTLLRVTSEIREYKKL